MTEFCSVFFLGKFFKNELFITTETHCLLNFMENVGNVIEIQIKYTRIVRLKLSRQIDKQQTDITVDKQLICDFYCWQLFAKNDFVT